MTLATTTYFLELNGSSNKQEEAGEVCIANISPLEQQKRLTFGIRQFVFTLAILGLMIILGLNPLWRFSLLFLFWAAATGYFQARDKT